MVATIAALTDPAAAASYYEAGADDYYVGDDRAASCWHGRAAQTLGLKGEVDPSTFAAMLDGRLPNGAMLGTVRDGAREHKLGWDLTFSAPKSVTTLALVAGDRRLLGAHERAVLTALDYAERHAAVTRVREAGGKPEPVATGSLAVALFPHYTARAAPNAPPDPQLHTHAVILNATLDDDAWRSLESRPIYKLQMAVGAIYHQQMAANVRDLGYSVTIADDGTFEIDDMPHDVSRAFSARAGQIEAALAERGKTRASASAAEKATITLDTRAPKEAVDHHDLVTAWRERADELGFGEDVRRRIVAQAEARAAACLPLANRQRMIKADQAVAFAAAKIGERDSTFSAASIEREAGAAAQARIGHGDIVAAIARAERRQELVVRAAPGAARGVGGFATRQAIETERNMLALEAEGRGKVRPLYTRDERIDAGKIVGAAIEAAKERGHTWTHGQRDATMGLLTSADTITAVQGSAGTAKTTTVLSTYVTAARAKGMAVRALSPTATAAAVLADAIGAEPMTVTIKLNQDPEADAGDRPEVWIVDEASMLSARDAERLLVQARTERARVILVGDVDQLGSVEAGRAFGQLQQAGMTTHILDEIVRQTNPHTRQAVQAMLAGDAKAAFEALDAGGGRVVEQPDDQTRMAVLARDFALLAPDERDATIVLDPTRDGRQRLTDSIRAALLREGQLGDQAVTATVLEPLGLTRAETRRAASYRSGSIVAFRAGDRHEGVRRHVAYRVEGVDAEAGTVRLADPDGKAVAWSPARWGSDVAEAFVEAEQEFRSGDKVQFTRNNYRAKRLNGHVATVLSVDPAAASLSIAMADGTRQTLDLSHLADRHIRPGWVRTIHSSQGATADRVMAHLESFRANTVDAASAYVAISRARKGAAIYTDNRPKLTEVLGFRDGAQVAALDEERGLHVGFDISD